MKPGWYPDPDDDNARRYWDGESWSAPLPRTTVGELPAGSLPDDVGTEPELAATPASRRRLVISGSVIALVAIAAVVVGLVLKSNSDEDDRKAAAAKSSAAASRSSASVAAASESSAEAAASAKAEADNTERTRRQAIVSALQDSITKDAKKDVRDGLLDGPIKSTDCTPVSGGSTDILTDTTGAFSCIAVNKTNDDGTESGYRFSATVNWSEESYTWHLGD